ncbi:MAG: chromate transporter [Candidatus Gastranaerophilales bacterium]
MHLKNNSFYNIFKIFFKIGTLLLGGGYVILPLLQSELVKKREWISDDELCEFYTLAQSVPGLITPNLSYFIGYKLNKIKGAIAATLGVISPSFISIIIIARIMDEVLHLSFIQHIFWGVSIGVLVLIFLAIKEMWSKCVTDNFALYVFFVAFFVSTILKISPSTLIISAVTLGILVQFVKKFTPKKIELEDETDLISKSCEEEL